MLTLIEVTLLAVKNSPSRAVWLNIEAIELIDDTMHSEEVGHWTKVWLKSKTANDDRFLAIKETSDELFQLLAAKPGSQKAKRVRRIK